MKRFILFLLAGLFYTTTMFAQVASITWPLTSTINPNTSIGNIQGLPEIIGVGSPLLSTSLPANLMSIYGYSNGQQLWVGNTGGTWVPDPPAPATPLIDPLRYIQFDASPTTGNIFTVTNVSFNYGDDPNITNFNILNFQAYYSTDGWQTKILLNSTPLVYLNLTMSTFNAQNLSVPVPSGQTFSLRIYMYPVLHGIAMARTFAIHNTVVISGTTAPALGSICGVKFNDLNGNGVKDPGELGLPNWIIKLSYNLAIGPVTLTDTTDASGNYCFNNLQGGGIYTVSETNQSGWQQTAPPSPGTHTVTLAAGQNIGSLNFGNMRALKCITPPDSMVGWWTGDNNANDISGFNNNGTLLGGATYGSGKVANAFTVMNAADYVTIPNHSSLNFGTLNFSIDAWVKTTDSTSVLNIVDKRTGTASNPVGYSLFISSGKLAFQMGDGSPTLNRAATTSPISDGKWHFVAVTVDRKNTTGGKLYVDGNQIFTFDPTTRSGSITNTAPLFIGQRHISSATQFNGQIDEVEIFNRVLSAGEILSIFAADSAGKCKPSVQLGSICGIKFNDLDGDGVKDPGELGLPNWIIKLSYNLAIGPVTLIDTTDASGNYCFNNLQPGGTYTVSETNQTGWQQTFPIAPGTHTVTLASGQNIGNINFGNKLDSCINGTKAWSPLGTGINNGTNGEVWALAVIGSDLYVGGNFTTAGGNTVNHIAKWNGSSWSALISSSSGVNGINGIVSALAVIGTDLYAGGWFTTAGGIPAENIAKWDGTNWSALGNGLPAAGAINALVAMGNNLYATSYILTPALGGPGNIIARWDGANWSAFSGMNDYVSSFLVDGSDLYAGGQFTIAGSVSANRIAKWNGTNWSPLGSGMNFFIGGAGIKMMAGNLYAGGRFTIAGGNPANFIAKWDGSTWSPLINGINNGMNNAVEGLAVIGTDLYASGSFTTAGGVNANSVAKWDGTNWSPLGSGMNDGVWRLAVIGNDLYAAGIFTTAGGVSANYIAKYSCGIPTSVDEDRTGNTLPKNFKLEQNYPNPFNPSTSITFSVPVAGKTTLKIYNLLGQEVATLVNRVIEAGTYSEQFSAANLSSGMYFYVLQSQNFREVKKMLLLK